MFHRALIVAAFLTGVVQAGPPLVQITGGGQATFDNALGGTIFSINVQIGADGTPRGHFFCHIPAVVVIVGSDLRNATDNGDGSITITGYGHGWDAAIGVYSDLPFALRVWAGGPGVGRFIYDDPVVGPSGGVDLDEGDRETVSVGQIRITRR